MRKAVLAVKVRARHPARSIRNASLSVFTAWIRATRRESGGTGLGLSIVKHAVQDLGGHLALSSTPGEGTEIKVYLPLKSAGLEAPCAFLPILANV